MSFLPEDYQAPKNSNNYMKLVDGENRIRILSKPVLGWEDWVENKPVRFRYDNRPAKSHDPKKPIRHFWAFIVWNYMEERIQILHLTQATIRSSIEGLIRDADWGEPYHYDLKIIRRGEGTDTEYMVNPLPHKAVMPKVVQAFREMPCNLEALFENADPFAKDWESHTPAFFDVEGKEPPKRSADAVITAAQAEELEKLFKECAPDYRDKVIGSLKGADPQFKTLEQLPVQLYERIRNAAIKKSKELAHA